MGVVLLLAVIWAAVLIPPALQAHAARREAFLVSFGRPPDADPLPVVPTRSQRVERRRHIAGGLLIAMVATLLVGLLPTFRVFLVVHLFLVDSFIAYIALLAHLANRASHLRRPRPVPVPQQPAPAAERRRRAPRRRPLLPELGSVAPAG
ncbi:MAG TPA: hypothetical protein VHF91_01590 [Acidimicrobiales bacterium]|nr:hypothetical protein [Acidimicrobiales bacterium]